MSQTMSISELKKRTTPIFKQHPVEKAILFGSYSKGEETSKSDIDLYIDTNGELKGLDFIGLLQILVDALGINVDLIDKKHIESNSLIIQEIEKGGIVIYEKSKDFIKEN